MGFTSSKRSAEKKFGYKPTPIPVAIDALAVYVHKDNPIQTPAEAQGPPVVLSSTPQKLNWPLETVLAPSVHNIRREFALALNQHL